MKTGLTYLPAPQHSRSYWDRRLSRNDSRHDYQRVKGNSATFHPVYSKTPVRPL